MKAKLIYAAVAAQMAFNVWMVWPSRTKFDPERATLDEKWFMQVNSGQVFRYNNYGQVEVYDPKSAKWIGLGSVSKDGLTALPKP